ncbi:MAG: DUF1080 domain-containing protein [Pirellulales bacterium]|nr:DUF1080 domain-containing protein [Pirellulales bacterium]
MKSKFLAACFMVLLASTTSLVAEESESGWIKMFDGETLNGWKANENPDQWTVVDGAIKTPPGRSHLFYVAQSFTDFEFKAQVKTTPGSNSGLFFHTKWQEEGWPAHGYESQVNQTHRDSIRSGSIYHVIKLYDSPAKDNQWYEHRIAVRGKNIRIHVNGKLVIDFTEPEGVTGTRRLSSGHIALQGHDPKSVVYFKDLQIRPLEAKK